MAKSKSGNGGDKTTTGSKSQSQTVQTTKTVKDEKAMIDKVNDQMTPREEGFMAKFVGTALIVLGVLFVLLAILVVFLSRRPASVNSDLPVPSINAPKQTKEESIKVKGETEDNGSVMFWVDGNIYPEVATANGEGKYEINIEAKEEGEYKIAAAYVKGFPVKQRSEKSKEVKVLVDRTPPSSDAKLDYEKVVSGDKMTIRGNTEPNTKVTVKLNGEEYSTTSDENGDFVVEDIRLSPGSNRMSVVFEDEAGNQVELDDDLVVDYVPGGDIDGDGIRDIGIDIDGDGIPDVDDGTELPEASGELEAAMDFLLGNRLMMLFGLLALAVFGVNTGLVAMKLRKA